MIEAREQGRSVVRLKGGDPFVFGRGGEEAEALAAAGVDFEVVPGVTAGVAAPAYAGIPVTHRDDASAVAFVTGHEDPGKAESALDWDALARFPGTLVLYMGVKRPRRDRRAPDRRGPRRRRARRRGRARHAARASAPSPRRWPRSPSAAEARGSARRRSSSSAPSRPGARRSPGSSAGRCTAAGRRHPGPGAGERARGPAARPRAPRWSSCRRSGSCRGSTPTRCRRRSRPALLRARLPDEPERRPAPVRGDGEAGPRRAGPRERDRRGDRARHRRGAPRARHHRRRRAGALRRRGPGRGARRRRRSQGKPVLVARAAEARDVLPEALRGRGAEVDVVALYETVAEPPDAAAVEARPGRRLRHLHLLLDRAQLRRGARRPASRRRPRRLDRPGDQRGRPRGRARGRTSRLSATTSTAWSRRSLEDATGS